MGIMDFFKPLTAWSTEQVRALLREKKPDEYNLVDVRQAGEYQREHLPGARHIPLGELEARREELPRNLPTLVYCDDGIRSRSGARTLVRANFPEVAIMEGGLDAWKGAVSTGEPELKMLYFVSADGPGELIGLAWRLEKGAESFYRGLAGILPDRKETFTGFADAEVGHASMLEDLYAKVAPSDAQPVEALFPEEEADAVMEGGVHVKDAIEWARQKDYPEALQLALALEANAWDLYVTMATESRDEQTREIFARIAELEKGHVQQISKQLDDALS